MTKRHDLLLMTIKLEKQRLTNGRRNWKIPRPLIGSASQA
jgi:hypothetical protein